MPFIPQLDGLSDYSRGRPGHRGSHRCPVSAPGCAGSCRPENHRISRKRFGSSAACFVQRFWVGVASSLAFPPWRGCPGLGSRSWLGIGGPNLSARCGLPQKRPLRVLRRPLSTRLHAFAKLASWIVDHRILLGMDCLRNSLRRDKFLSCHLNRATLLVYDGTSRSRRLRGCLRPGHLANSDFLAATASAARCRAKRWCCMITRRHQEKRPERPLCSSGVSRADRRLHMSTQRRECRQAFDPIACARAAPGSKPRWKIRKTPQPERRPRVCLSSINGSWSLSNRPRKERIMAGVNDVNRYPVIHTWSYKLAEAA